MRKNLEAHLFIDDFGTAFYECRYTGLPVGGDGATFTGALTPGVKTRYVMGTSEAAKAGMKASRQAFNEMDSNCNTCGNLDRMKHEKRRDGFLLGVCKAGKVEGVMTFHPDDYMGMPCWVTRENQKPMKSQITGAQA
jgi:hypothetical protein